MTTYNTLIKEHNKNKDDIVGINSQLADIPNQNYITEKATKKEVNSTNAKIDINNIISRCNLGLSGKVSNISIASGKITKWYDQSNILLGGKAYQEMDDNQPLLIENIPYCISMTPLPDIADGVVGKGFTCTGLTYDKNEDIFYAGNIGKDLPATNGFKSTIVKLSKDGTTNLGEINLYTTFSTMSDIQGLTIDASDNTIWFCSYTENKIRHITKSGADLGSLDFTQPTGIVYDSRTNTLWVLSLSALKNIDKMGNVIKSINISIIGQDQLYLDITNNIMYFTAGNYYNSTNYVYKVDLSTDVVSLAYNLKESYAVEGIYIEDNIMYILNDGYYHSGTIAVNQLNKYDITNLSYAPQFDSANDTLIIDSNTDIDNLNKITIVAVVQVHETGGTNFGRIFDKINSSQQGYCLSIPYGTGLQFVQYRTDGVYAWDCPNTLVKGKTYHVVITFDKSLSTNIPQLYINGILQVLSNVGTTTGSYTSDSGIPMYIGNDRNLTKGLNGFIHELYVVNKILTQEGITNIYNIAKKYYNL